MLRENPVIITVLLTIVAFILLIFNANASANTYDATIDLAVLVLILYSIKSIWDIKGINKLVMTILCFLFYIGFLVL